MSLPDTNQWFALQIRTRWERRAAEIYIAMTKDKSPLEDMLKIVNDPQIEYSLMPKNVSTSSGCRKPSRATLLAVR